MRYLKLFLISIFMVSCTLESKNEVNFREFKINEKINIKLTIEGYLSPRYIAELFEIKTKRRTDFVFCSDYFLVDFSEKKPKIFTSGIKLLRNELDFNIVDTTNVFM